jgi:hypothetical protein
MLIHRIKNEFIFGWNSKYSKESFNLILSVNPVLFTTALSSFKLFKERKWNEEGHDMSEIISLTARRLSVFYFKMAVTFLWGGVESHRAST